ncbi:MAG: LysM peptidoglycan-binding domain-containing protein [Planctomycetota bacterium]|jgi:nucleoid-associated protein YgaU
MTSDAKIGLLLGLVFIFIIAYLINGLPSFRKSRNNSELTTNGLGLQNNAPGLAVRERKAQEIFRTKKLVGRERFDEALSPSVHKQDIRSITPLPQSTVKSTYEIQPSAPTRPSSSGKETEVVKVKPNKPALPKAYVVVDGDNLAVIAKKFYGDEEGNKRTNVMKIFQANRKVLKSPDEVYIGQKLIIPPMPTSTADKSKAEGVFSATIFEKVKSLGQRILSSDGGKGKQGRRHIVREGENLWKIATEQLGDGSRYTEIAKLNSGILDDENSLSIGMRLTIPAQ